jgi:hypothetical protein
LPDGRRFVFKPKITTWVIFFGGVGCAMENLGIFYDHLGLFYDRCKYFMAIWYILRSFGIFLPVLVFCIKKNLATLFWTAHGEKILPIRFESTLPTLQCEYEGWLLYTHAACIFVIQNTISHEMSFG